MNKKSNGYGTKVVDDEHEWPVMTTLDLSHKLTKTTTTTTTTTKIKTKTKTQTFGQDKNVAQNQAMNE